MERVLIALGSNINSECNMREAVLRLASRCRLVAVSPVYETAPVGNTEQPDFMNAAALIETNLTATELKADVLQTIEQETGPCAHRGQECTAHNRPRYRTFRRTGAGSRISTHT